MTPTVARRSPVSVWGLIIWGVGSLFFIYEFFLRTFLGSVAQPVMADLHISMAAFSMLGAAYAIAFGLMQMPVGILVDRYGARANMTAAVLVCAVGTTLLSQTHSFYQAFLARMMMGLGSSFAFVCLLMIVSAWFPKRYFGFFSGASQLIGSLGPFLAGGPLVSFMQHYHQSWRSTLYGLSMGAYVLAGLVCMVVRNRPPSPEGRAITYLTKTPSLTLLLKRLLHNRQVWCVACYSASVYIAMDVLCALWGKTYLQTRGLLPSMAAMMISTTWVGYAMGCPLLGGLSDIARRRRPTLLFCAVVGLLSTLGIVYMDLAGHQWVYSIFFFGLGLAGAGQNLGFATITEYVDSPTKATSLALNNAMITLYSATIPPLISMIIQSSSRASGTLNAAAFKVGLGLLPLMYVVAVLLVVFGLRETYGRCQKELIHVTI